MKRILFLTGTRADFGKIKSLIEILQHKEEFDVHIFVTGMHLQSLYGSTYIEIEKCNYKNIYKYINQTSETTMDLTLAKTIEGLSSYVKEFPTDLIIIHGDRVEALAGAIVGSLNNILVAHIEGGEISGTIDELIRHAVSKMSHIHFVSNYEAKKRLIQMGEAQDVVFVTGSPDMDLMFSEKLPNIDIVKKYYEIEFNKYGIVLYHPVTTEYLEMKNHVQNFVDALIEDNNNYVVIYPNNDLGSAFIRAEYERLKNNKRFRIFPSIKFESFLMLLKNANFMIGNSSAVIREAPAYGIPSINIGTRQNNRAINPTIINSRDDKVSILNAIQQAKTTIYDKKMMFGSGNSDKIFLQILQQQKFWETTNQKKFIDL